MDCSHLYTRVTAPSASFVQNTKAIIISQQVASILAKLKQRFAEAEAVRRRLALISLWLLKFYKLLPVGS